jgi:alpha-glucosidase
MSGWADIPELVRYAGAKGVKVWIWAHWTAVDRQMEEAFPLYEKWGVAGVKVDYMMRDDQTMVGFYYRVAEQAARHHLMVDFHGASKPWGMERTWPNVLGYEGILGMEQSWATGRDMPNQHVMFPFTRMLAGMMDYTPGSFHNVTKAEFDRSAGDHGYAGAPVGDVRRLRVAAPDGLRLPNRISRSAGLRFYQVHPAHLG